MDATSSPELLRIPEAAERLNISRASVYRWIEEGRLPAIQLGGRGAPLRIPAAELERWLGRQMSTVGSGSCADPPPLGSALGRGSSVGAGVSLPAPAETPAAHVRNPEVKGSRIRAQRAGGGR
jgi:excisionase family DNA binding protein